MTARLVILGAPRSGTNMLRDALTSFPEFGTWPCDEINYIWRHGNVGYPTDELPAEAATPAVVKYIRRQFDAMQARLGCEVLVEKTCANCLRVPFVHRVVPEARFVYIYRDGIDAVGSGMLRWTASLDFRYLVAKARFVPPSDLPYYASRYLWSRLQRFHTRERRVGSWGPVIAGMDRLVSERSLAEVCAYQWERCVALAELGLQGMDPERCIRVRYEDFVTSPRAEIRRVLAFVGIEADHEQVASVSKRISPNSIGKGRSALGREESARLEQLVAPSLRHYGYI